MSIAYKRKRRKLHNKPTAFPNTLAWHKKIIRPSISESVPLAPLATERQKMYLIDLGVPEEEIELMTKYMAMKKITELLRKKHHA